MKFKIIFTSLILLSLLALGVWQWQNKEVPKDPAKEKKIDITAVVNNPRPDFSFKDLQGKQHKASDWNGKVLVVNFWATWCPPCRREMPAFVRLQKKYGDQGVQFVGIALDDQDQVQDYIDNMEEMNYPILVGDREAFELAEAYGDHVGALPHTAIVDRKGNIAHVKSGELHESELETILKGLL